MIDMRTARALMLILGLTVCSSFASEPRTLKTRLTAEPETFDWHISRTAVSGFVTRNIMEGLLSEGPGRKVAPGLATRWTQSKDGTAFTFYLKPGVLWSDGVPLEAQHFVDGIRRVLSLQNIVPRGHPLLEIINAEDFNSGREKDFTKVGVKALDRGTLEIRIRKATPSWIWLATFPITYPIRRELIEKAPNDWATPGKMVTLGPYVAKAKDARTVTLERNPKYHEKMGNIDRVVISFIADDAIAVHLYDRNELQLLPTVSVLSDELKTRKDLFSYPTFGTFHVDFNLNRKPSSDLHLRRAIAMAIDRSKLTKFADKGYTPAVSLVPPGLVGHTKDAAPHFDPTKAKTELALSGYDHKTPLELISIASEDNSQLTAFLRSELKRNLDIETTVSNLVPQSFITAVALGNYHLVIYNMVPKLPDADYYFSFLAHADTMRQIFASNPRIADLVNKVHETENRAKREGFARDLQQVLEQDIVAFVPLYHGRTWGLVRKSFVTGFEPDPFRPILFKQLSVH